jgi:monovalent cation:H+ antiporter-2, CPA2 family
MERAIVTMHSYDLILTLTGGLVGALVCGYVTQRLKLSPIVGYLVAGLVIGPNTPGFVANQAIAEQLAEVGVILLMFGVGLQFHVEELLAVRRVAVPGAVVQSAVATALGVVIGFANGWSLAAGLVFGVALSVASTVVLIRMLSDNGQLHTPTGHIAVGWLVVEDVFTVLVLVLMPALFGPGKGQSPAASFVVALLKIGGLIAVAIWAGGRAIPWVLTRVARTQSRELFTLAVLATALGIAVASAELFGVSMALGAFLAGLIVGRSDFSLRAAADALPMRDAFAVLFFVSVGMLMNPARMLARPDLIAATLAVVMLGKPLVAFAIVRMFRQPARVGLAVAAALGQIGEFSFIVATLAFQLGVMTEAARDAIVAAAILSIAANPFLFRTIPAVERWLRPRPDPRAADPAIREEGGSRAVVVGYGPVGRAVARLLGENEIRCTVIEMNIDTVRELAGSGTRAVYGDATHEDILRAAGLGDAQSLIISSVGLAGVEEMLRTAKRINPRVQVLARASYLRETAALRAAGADEVFSGEGEVALAFTAAILARLGATPEQLDRERARVHAELG